MRAEGAALDDALRLELQAVPGLRVIDIGDQPEMPVDTLRARYGADWIILGALDRVGDSVGATVRVLDASMVPRCGAGCCGGHRRRAAAVRDRARGSRASLRAVRYAMDSVLLDRWLAGAGH